MLNVEGLAHNFAFGPALYEDLRPPSRCQPGPFVCLSRLAIENYPQDTADHIKILACIIFYLLEIHVSYTRAASFPL